uniref:Uncharacterized protein n=1 Tax=Candidatus Kentrum eta TaxID=2126337 RepID=A0A450UM04_9GAMM|nr:MAG: hypothetical protein BECKH772A_GA0070896_1000812 [Candidatus Kentron sp. H]VFJ93554.1 MAG: hypothetical protein BECKH772B_GA0070898_1004616 [Candidatus Kentron sp. H]VFJ94877.1 MAG: hypothetical protein BECKH772C_GA0070978_1000136 [Candidatus Kentron sp. H]
MKTMLLEIEDSLYGRLMAFIEQLPTGQVRVLDEQAEESSALPIEEAAAYVLSKNAELYERLS